MLKIPVGLKHISTVGFLLLKRKMCNYNEANGISSSVGRTFVSFFIIFPGFLKKNLAAAYAAVCVSFFYESILFRGTSSFSVSFTLFCVFVFVV